ncbi:hypothetical protein BH09ACT10_BH09ACT10_23850 [soil metagenome]
MALLAIPGLIVWAMHARSATPLESPSDLQATADSPSSATISWSGDSNADKFVVVVGADRALSTATKTVTTQAMTTDVTGLTATASGGTTFYRVDSYRGDELVKSEVGSFHLLPAEATGLTIKKISRTKAQLSWAPSANATNFDIMQSDDERFSEPVILGRTPDNKTSATIGQLSPGTTYYFKVRSVNGPEVGAYGAAVTAKTLAPDIIFNAGTFNLCSEKCKNYSTRARIAKKLFTTNEIDIFGLQEAGGERVGATTNAIFRGGSRGYARATGGAEARYVLYRPALFKQLGGGHFAIGHGRYTTWALFKSKVSKAKFYFTSTHLISGKSSKQNGKRKTETRKLLAKMRSINEKNYPVVYAGDFNSNSDRSYDAPAAVMKSAGVLNSRFHSSTKPINTSINSGHTFSTRVIRTGVNVDYIWVTPDIDVMAWKSLVRITNGRYTKPMISDHNALKATLSIASINPKIGEATALLPVPESE